MPEDGGLVGAQILSYSRIAEWGWLAPQQLQTTERGDHAAIVDAQRFLRYMRGAISILRHMRTHISQSLIASHTSAKEQLVLARMGHRAFCDLDAGRIGVFLKRPADRGQGLAPIDQIQSCTEQS